MPSNYCMSNISNDFQVSNSEVPETIQINTEENNIRNENTFQIELPRELEQFIINYYEIEPHPLRIVRSLIRQQIQYYNVRPESIIHHPRLNRYFTNLSIISKVHSRLFYDLYNTYSINREEYAEFLLRDQDILTRYRELYYSNICQECVIRINHRRRHYYHSRDTENSFPISIDIATAFTYVDDVIEPSKNKKNKKSKHSKRLISLISTINRIHVTLSLRVSNTMYLLYKIVT